MRYTAPQWRPSRAQRRTPLRSVIEVSGLASILLVLLFLFMPMETDVPRHIPADLPSTHHAPFKPAALRDDAIIITITRDGSVYFRNARASLDDLPGLLREALRDAAEKTAYINADSRAKYADVKALVDRIRDAGISNITFLSESSRP